MNKLVSIILPTYNGSNRIKRAIGSIVNQTYTNWELLIIDDGSTDNTTEIIDSFIKTDLRIKYIKNGTNLDIQKSLNRGLKEAKGAYIARIDDDDEWIDEDKLMRQVEFLDSHPEHVLIGTGVIVVDEQKKELFRYLLPETDNQIRQKILGKNCFVHSSVMFWRIEALKFGGYDETEKTKHVEDYDLWLKLGTVGKFHNLSICAVKFTLREGSISSNNKLKQFLKILSLIKKFKNNYPNYFLSAIRSYLRIVIYGFILKFPIKFSINRLIKFYKENW